MNFLLSTFALLLGPFVVAISQKSPGARQLLDGFVLLSVGWIIGVHIVPEVVSVGGAIAIVIIVAGMAFPFVLRRIFHLASSAAHIMILVLAAIALALHAAIDGIALLPANGNTLAIAVILHRLPIGIAIWWTFRPALGRTAALAAFAIIIAATGAAYYFGGSLVSVMESLTLAHFQAFVSGGLIDLVLVGLREKIRR